MLYAVVSLVPVMVPTEAPFLLISITFKADENSTLALDADDIGDMVDFEGELDEDNTNYSEKSENSIPDFIESDSESDEDEDE